MMPPIYTWWRSQTKSINQILTMTWNKRYDQFALSCGLRHSSERLLRWLLRRAKPNQVVEIEIDLRVFNKFIKRDRGRPYDRKTIKEALTQLDEKTQGLILITKSYTWAIKKVIVRPLAVVLQTKSQTGDKSLKLNRGNPMFSEERKKRAKELLLQNISRLDSFLKQLGMNYDHESLMRIWKFSGKNMSEIKNAVEYMFRVNNEKLEHSESLNGEPKGIRTAKGWLHDCLRKGWHIYDQEVELPYINGDYIHSFIDSLMGTSRFEWEASHSKADCKIPKCPT